MPHINDQVRSAVVVAVTGLESTGPRVDLDYLTVRDIVAPRLVVRVETGDVEVDAVGLQTRALVVTVAGYVKALAAGAGLGEIQAEVEAAIHGAGTLGGLVPGGLVLLGDERELAYDALEKPAGVVTLRFSAQVFTRAGQPETHL